MSKQVLQKAYVVIMITLLLGVVAMRNESILGNRLFVIDTGEPQITAFALSDIKELYPSANKYTVVQDSILVYADDNKLGWAYNTSPGSDSIVGYTTSVPLLLGFNTNNKVIGIRLLKNYESPDFVEKIVKSRFLDSWDKISLNDLPQTHIDAFSGATLTSSAIIKTVQHSTGKLSQQSVSLKRPTDILYILKVIAGYLLILLALLQFFAPKKLRKVRTIYLVLVVAILGFWLGTFLSLFSFNNWIIYGIDLPSKLFVFTILVLSLTLPLITNKAFYCSHLCPFGASQDLLGKIRKKRFNLSNNLKQFLATLREKVFACIMLLLFTGVAFDLTNIEPFSAFLFRSASIPIMVLAGTFLLLSIFIPRPWCNYVCPTGYLLETIRKPFKK
ncbi:4Fe-4S binding protein [Labilibacter marinus]|uniref:4Fe-4S binding protein n=1 Tax=Labilibacter marinus TaxID=1477105 RepID=UPI0013012E20|nr:4Fe-4S binding protein [Labilibacter marinus]